MIKRTTFFDKKEARWVTVLLDSANHRAYHHKHPRIVTTFVKARRLGKAVKFPPTTSPRGEVLDG